MPVWETTLSQVSISVASLCGRVSDARVRTKLLILSPTTTKENPLHLARWDACVVKHLFYQVICKCWFLAVKAEKNVIAIETVS